MAAAEFRLPGLCARAARTDPCARTNPIVFADNSSDPRVIFMFAWSRNVMKLLKKSLIVTTISVLMSIVLFFIHQLVTERSERRDATALDVARSVAGSQSVRGPMLLLTTETKAGVIEHHYVLPEEIHGTAHANVLVRKRSIYRVPSFVAQHHLAGEFLIPEKLVSDRETKISVQLFIGITDPQGVKGKPLAKLDGHVDGLEIMTGGSGIAGPIHTAASGARIPFELDLELEGTRALQWGLYAKNSTLQVSSDWKDPSFAGWRLPTQRDVSSSGFNATWETNAFSNQVALVGPLTEKDAVLRGPVAGVDFVEPVDVYTQADRATKYGFLFIGLTFAAFFLFEITKQLPIHPMQYVMVGLEMAVFFLLLLSLAEHVPFVAAYALASIACVVATVFYLRHILHGWTRGVGFGGMQGGLYGALFVLLRADEYALLLGSGLLFGLICGAMFATRNVDWFAAKADDLPGCHRPPQERPIGCVGTVPYR